jgi:hypothetical protein
MGVHAVKSASGSKRWINCPGSIRMSVGRESESSEAARLGTAAHGLGEYCLVFKITDVSTMVGGCVLLDENEDATVLPPGDDAETAHMHASFGNDMPGYFHIDDNMADSVQVYVDTCLAELERHPDATMMVEERFKLAEDMFGTNDCAVLLEFEHLTVLDLKHGQGVVVEVQDEPTARMDDLMARAAVASRIRGNSQLLYYALGIAKKVEWAFNTLDLVIVQPRARHEEGGVRRYSTTVGELRDFEKVIMLAAAETDAPDAPLSAGDWCGFCPAAGVCPELRDEAYRVAALDFSDGAVRISREANEMTDEELAKAAVLVGVLDAHIKAVRGEVMTRLRSSEDGTWQGAFKLVRGKANRKWEDPDAAIKRLENFGFGPSSLYEKKLLTPAKVEKLRPDHFKDLGIRPKDIKAVVAEVAIKPEGKVVVAPISDPRDPVAPSAAAASDFAVDYEGDGNGDD